MRKNAFRQSLLVSRLHQQAASIMRVNMCGRVL